MQGAGALGASSPPLGTSWSRTTPTTPPGYASLITGTAAAAARPTSPPRHCVRAPRSEASRRLTAEQARRRGAAGGPGLATDQKLKAGQADQLGRQRLIQGSKQSLQ